MTDLSRLRFWAALLMLTPLLVACGDEPPPPPVFPSAVNVGNSPSSRGFGWVDSAGHRHGFDHDLTEWFGQQIGFTPVPVDVIASTKENALQTGIVTLIVATYAITDARKRHVSFAGPYMLGYQGVMVRAEDRTKYARLQDLRGKSVCASAGSTSIEELKLIREPMGIAVVERNVYDECLQALHARAVDAISTDQLLLAGIAVSDPQVYVLPGVTFGNQVRWGIGVPKGDMAKCELIRKQIRYFLASDTWEVFFEKNLPGVDKTGHKPDPSQLDECK
jgi:glutamate transport system substrate-binding protein